MSDETPKDPIEEVQERRAARKAALKAKYDEQYAKDLEALDELEIKHGDSNVKPIMVPFTPGLPTLVVVRTPKPSEIKRHRARLKDRPGEKADPVEAAEELGRTCRVYPDADTFKQMEEARAGIASQVGVFAGNLAYGSEADEGKG